MNRLIAAILLSILVCCSLSGAVSIADNRSVKTLEILCTGAMRPPVEEMLVAYQKQTGVHMQISYSPANILIQQIRMRPHGDVFIPADRYYTDQAIKAGIVETPSVFAYLIPVIIVQKANPFNVRTLSDMTRNDIRVGLVDERVGAIGRLFVALLKKNHIKLDQLNIMFNAPMVGELANAIKLKSIDVAVVWKPIAVAYQKEADYISIPENKNIVVPVSAGIIKTSSNKPDARKFLKFMTSKEGKAILEKHHYPTTDPRKH